MSGWNGIDPQTAAGLSTLAAVVTQWEPTLRNANLAEEQRRIHTPPQFRSGGAAGAAERAAEAAEPTEGA